MRIGFKLLKFEKILFILFAFLAQNSLGNELLKIQEEDLVMGDLNAPITIIEYASLSCPHCASFHNDTLPIIKKEYIDTGKVKYIFRDFPLNLPALHGSMIVRCVEDDLYFKYLNALFSLQSSWVRATDSREYLFEIIKNGGMSRSDFDSCLANKEIENQILKNQIAAQQQFRIKTTPSFVINGSLVEGNKPIDTFRTIFDNILSY